MIHARDFVNAARARGFERYAGVPCSFLTPFINYVIGDDTLHYVSAANEGDAVAIAAGSALGGQRAVAMMQNSGLGNAVSPLTSLTWTFRIPILVICTHRGAPGVKDEPQHELMGRITGEMFDTMRIPWTPFPSAGEDIAVALDQVDANHTGESRPHALIMHKGTCEPFPLSGNGAPPRRAHTGVTRIDDDQDGNDRLSRHEVLSLLVERSDPRSTVVIATTGFTGRELYAVDDRSNHLYMVGSMGCAASLGLGLALARPDLRVIVVDGDGAALMRMGNLASVGAYAPVNFTHLVLDNEAHDSTGTQATVSANTDFAAIAAACGYANVMAGNSRDALKAALDATPGPVFLHMKIRAGAIDNLPRPAISPEDVRARLQSHIGVDQGDRGS